MLKRLAPTAVGFLLINAAAFAGPAVVGHDRYDGRVLLGELNCTACHKPGGASNQLIAKQAPVLAEVGSRATPQWLRAYLTDPPKAKPGTAMPHLLHTVPAAERDRAVDELVHYLAGLGGPIDTKSSYAYASEIDAGKNLYHTAGCVACHKPFEPAPKIEGEGGLTIPGLPMSKRRPADGPKTVNFPLGDLAGKTTVDALATFLANPLHARPSGRMPSLHLTAAEARAVAAYLLREQYDGNRPAPAPGVEFGYYPGRVGRLPDFDKLKPARTGVAKNFRLAELPAVRGRRPTSDYAVRYRGTLSVPDAGVYRFRARSDDGSALYINGKRIVDNDGVHGEQNRGGAVRLAGGIHRIEVQFFQVLGGQRLSVEWRPPSAKKFGPIPAKLLSHSSAAKMTPTGTGPFRRDAAKAARGKLRFAQLGCVNCHAVDRRAGPQYTLKAPELLKLRPAAPGGCLSESPAAGRPQYGLDAKQRRAMARALAALPRAKPLTAERHVALKMNAMNCYACHKRDDVGGPNGDRQGYFTYRLTVDLGQEGRLPPSLTGVGAKLTPAGYDEALHSGRAYRTYMATRMPAFGRANLAELPKRLTAADAGLVKPRAPEFSGELVEAGRRLVGIKALGCINCHAWGEYRIQGAEGLNFLRVTKRIKPGWFHDFMYDPQKLKPGTRMPTAWPNGKTFFNDIAGGDTRRQIDAVWAYLAAGEKGGLPDGLKPTDDRLVPAGEPIVFRTFLSGVSAHAVVVGFRQRTHYAFDANRVRAVLAWAGDFVATKQTWEGRAGQYTPVPSNEVLRFPDGPPFAGLADRGAGWPKDAPKKRLGSDRTPAGYEFRGYRLGKGRVPTLLYKAGPLDVAETTTTAYRRDGAYLKRHFAVTAAGPAKGQYLIAAAGKSISPGEGGYRIDGKFTCVAPAGSFVRESAGRKELLVPVTPAAGNKTSITLEYIW